MERWIISFKEAIHDCSVVGLVPVWNGPPQEEGWRFCLFCGERLATVQRVTKDVEVGENSLELR